MADKSIEEKVKVNDFLDLYKAPVNSWVEINKMNEFKIFYSSSRKVITLSIEDKYICKKRYDRFLGSLTPLYIEKFLIGIGKSVNYLKTLRDEGRLEL